MATLELSQLVMQIGGLRAQELIIIAIIVIVLFFGARKIPELARSLGKASGEFEKGKAEARREIERLKKSMSEDGLKRAEDLEKLIKAAQELGIETEGKTEVQLKEEVQKALTK